MAYFATTYRYVDDAERVSAVRPEHRDYLAQLSDQGGLQISGPLVGGEPGALLIFVAESEAAARELVAADPFVRDGLVAELTVREWNPVSGAVLDQF